MNDIASLFSSERIDYHRDIGIDKIYPLGNMSFCDISGIDVGYGKREPGGRILVSVRQFNYLIETDGTGGVERKSHMLGSFLKNRMCHFVVADRDFNFIRKLKCNYSILYALEDVRLARFGDVVQASATNVLYGPSMYRMCQHDLVISGDEVLFTRPRVFPKTREKNYIPSVSEKSMYITDMDDGFISTVDSENQYRKIRSRCDGIVKCSGSTQLFPFDLDGEKLQVALVHRREDRRYVNAFAFFSEDLRKCRLSTWFTVFGNLSPVNFTCGMSVEDGVATLPVCVNDGDTRLFRIHLKDFAR